MGRLEHVKFYLGGQVEFGGTFHWQGDLARNIAAFEPTVTVWSPLVKPEWVSSECKDLVAALDKIAMFALPRYDQSIANERKQQTWKSNSDARRLCLHLANQADILIAKVTKVFTWGTIKELEDAITRGIPIFMILPDGPLGVFGMPGITENHKHLHEYIHYSEESLLKKLEAISNGTDNLPECDPERWLFLTYPNIAKAQNGNQSPV